MLVIASSVHIWKDVLIPTAADLDSDAKLREVCSVLVESDLPPTLCARTFFSLFSGIVAACLSFGAIVTHFRARFGAARVVENTEDVCAPALAFSSNTPDPFTGTFLPLQSEFILAVVLSNLLGLNAVFATAVNGPAATVGNLYYASWISFLLCLRICLGCLEELCNMDTETKVQSPKSGGYDPPSVVASETTNRSEISPDDFFPNPTDLLENERAQRTRKYLFLCITSTVCSASALDAAMYEEEDLSMEQSYVIFAPSLVAVVCACQFLLCLHTRTYRIVSQMWLGGLLSVLTCAVCAVSLVLTMHSEFSWAVNAIGEIQIANLYYFTWASIITAGLQMMSYMKNHVGLKAEDYLTVVWMAVCKVCFVILGAGYHIWYNISGACTLDAIRSGAVTFCSRTVLSIAVACTGLIVSGLTAFVRILFSTGCPNSKGRARAHVEMVLSLFLVLLFGTGVALITGIGGPGQSVGDLFYGTWLAFLVSIGLVAACFEEIQRVDTEGVGPTPDGGDPI